MASLWWQAVGGLCVILASLAFHPQRASCPRGWWVNGIRPSGSFECMKTDNVESSETVPHEDLHMSGRLICSGTRALVWDQQTVWCER